MHETKKCECHNEIMRWRADKRYKNGGYYCCLVKQRENDRRRYDENAFYRIKSNLRRAAKQRELRLLEKIRRTLG